VGSIATFQGGQCGCFILTLAYVSFGIDGWITDWPTIESSLKNSRGTVFTLDLVSRDGSHNANQLALYRFRKSQHLLDETVE
jgi:hypothetical protein